MQVEVNKSEVRRITGIDFLRMNPAQQRQVVIRVLRRRNNRASAFVADQLLRGNPNFEFVVSDDVSSLT